MRLVRIFMALALGMLGHTSVFSQGTPCTAVAPNTNCSAPSNVTIPAGFTAAGSGISNPSCGGGTNDGNYWITYTIPAGVSSWSLSFIRPTGGGRVADIGVQVYTASSSTCASATFTLQGCYNSAGTDVSTELQVTPGQIYYIRVYDTDGASSGNNFDYCTTTNVTGNTPCAARPITSFPYSFSGNTSSAGITNTMTGGCGGSWAPASGGANDYFFSVTVAANSYLTMSLTGTSSANYTELSVLTATSCSATSWTCVSNGAWSGGLQAQGGATSTPCRTVYFATAGTYYLRVDGNTGSNGPFTLNVNSYTPTAGDACSNAVGMSSGSPVTINNTNCAYTIGTDDPTPSSLFCAGTVENTNWLVFQANGSGTPISVNVNAVTCNTGYYAAGPPAGLYSASGQFGILTSSTGSCGGTYSTAVACQSLSTGSTFSTTLSNTTVRNYYFIWDGNGGAECTYTITVTNVNPLPVELISFNGKYVGKKVQLQWATNSEINNDYFTVERSLDSKIFSEVNTVDGKGNSNSVNIYSVTDDQPNRDGVTYYRLKQTDFDGTVKYSDVIAVKNDGRSIANVFPNPFTDEITIDLGKETISTLDIVLSDITGNIVFAKQLEGSNSRQVKISGLSLDKGVYFYKISQDGINTTGKIVKN